MLVLKMPHYPFLFRKAKKWWSSKKMNNKQLYQLFIKMKAIYLCLFFLSLAIAEHWSENTNVIMVTNDFMLSKKLGLSQIIITIGSSI
jgi:hypothetical protein